MVAALYVEPDGAYFGQPDVDPRDESRDARLYAGPHPVVAHPPCKRWGRFWHGCPIKPHVFKLGTDAGCFAAALTSVRNWGGCLEHPADSQAFAYFGLAKPERHKGWQPADRFGAACYVEQGHYGHVARKPTWLYAVGSSFPDLNWSRGEQRLPAYAVERYGYEKARRIGVMAAIGTKRKTILRDATPAQFRDVLLAIARGDR